MKPRFSNWSGSVRFQPRKIIKPQSDQELSDCVIQAVAAGSKIRVVGTGHSFMPLIETDDLLISLDEMQGLTHLDSASGDATLLGGTKLWKMNQLLFQQGRCLENLGDIDRQSIAGTVSTGTHGTGTRFGTISTQARELSLMTADGKTLVCSKSENAELFQAVRVSLGALGIITQVKLKTLPAYRLKYRQEKETIDQVLNHLPASSQNYRHFEFFCFGYSPWVQAKYADETTDAVSAHQWVSKLNAIVMENLLFKILSEVSRLIPAMTQPIARLCGSAISGGEKTSWAHEVFSTPRWVKFQEMEYNVPAIAMKDTVTELRAMIEKKNLRVHFPIECRYVKGDDIWLSPAYQRDSAYIAIHQYRGMEYEPYFKAAESIFRNHGGRPHWAKMHFLSAKELKPLYPMWEPFQQMRRQLDPKQIFMNPALQRLFES